MIKPDGAHRGLIDEIISRFEKKGFYLKGLKLQNMEKSFAGSTRPICPFFDRLVEYIVSDHGRDNATATTIAKSKWGPYSGAGDFAGNMAVILASLLAALALALAIHAGVRHLLPRRRKRLRGAAAADPEKPPAVEVAPAPTLLQLVYSASGTELAGSASECAICPAEFADGDAVRAVPACGHGFHARCIERWLAPGGRWSSCPTCRAPASTPVPPAPAPDGAPAPAS